MFRFQKIIGELQEQGMQVEAFYEALLAINYKGAVSIESFTPENKELAGAVCIWRNLAEDQDTFAREGHEFLKRWAANQLD